MKLEDDPRINNIRIQDEAESNTMAAAELILRSLFHDAPLFLMVAIPDGTPTGHNIETFLNGPPVMMGEMLQMVGTKLMELGDEASH